MLALTLVFLVSVFSGPNHMVNSSMSKSTDEVIILGGGCFWCIEPIFDDLKGVKRVESGYSGGSTVNPTYEQICTGRTGHAEVIEVTFDPQVISLEDILRVFFTVHDPTTLNRQGPDIGTQYRSAVFYRNERQKAVTEEIVREMQDARIWEAPFVTEIVPFKAFYKAEDYHQEYFRLNPNQPYCRVVIAPKVAKFREKYRSALKK